MERPRKKHQRSKDYSNMTNDPSHRSAPTQDDTHQQAEGHAEEEEQENSDAEDDAEKEENLYSDASDGEPSSICPKVDNAGTKHEPTSSTSSIDSKEI